MVNILVLASSLTATTAAAPDARVRTDEPRIRALVGTGLARSPTFRSLVTALNESDVIVYIQLKEIHAGLGGYLHDEVVARGMTRFLRVVIHPNAGDERLIAVIAHELQHAVEIARDPDVGRSKSFEAFFSQIGFRRDACILSCFETNEARTVEILVSREIRSVQMRRDISVTDGDRPTSP